MSKFMVLAAVALFQCSAGTVLARVTPETPREFEVMQAMDRGDPEAQVGFEKSPGDTIDFGSYHWLGGIKYATLGEVWTWDHGLGDPHEGWVCVNLTSQHGTFFRLMSGEDQNPVPKESVEFSGVFGEILPSGHAYLWYDFNTNRWCKITNPDLRLFETPEGTVIAIPKPRDGEPADERWSDDLPFALDDPWNNVEELSGVDLDFVLERWGGLRDGWLSGIVGILATHMTDSDRVLLLIMYKTYGGDIDRLKYVTDELQKGRSFTDIITDQYVAGGIIAEAFIGRIDKILAMAGPALTAALKNLPKQSVTNALESFGTRVFNKEFLAKNGGELEALLASLAKSHKRTDEIVDTYVKKLIALGNANLTEADIQVLKEAVKAAIESGFSSLIQEWLQEGEEQGWFEEGEGEYCLGTHTIVPTPEFESVIGEQVLVSLFDGFEGGRRITPTTSGSGFALCGVRQAEADSLGWLSGAGYGNDFCQRLTSPPYTYDGTGSVDFSLLYFNDTEAGHDYSYVRVVAGASTVDLTDGGWSGAIGIDPLTGVITPALFSHGISNGDLGGGSYPRTFTVVIEFISDGAGSDEDGGVDSWYGPVGIDSVNIGPGNLDPPVAHTYQFGTSLQGWLPGVCPGVGSFFGTVDIGGGYNILDPCSCALSGNVMRLHDETGQHPVGQHEMLCSPIVDRENDIPGGNYLAYNRIMAEWNQYSDLPRDSGVFYRPGWSYYPYESPLDPGHSEWSPRVGIDTFYFSGGGGGTPACRLHRNIGTDWGLPPDCRPPAATQTPPPVATPKSST